MSLALGTFSVGRFAGDEYEPGFVASRVAVLVESAEHARALNVLLPGWPVVTAKDITNTHRRSATFPAADRFIITRAAVDRFGLDADAVVRAEGGYSSLRLTPEQSSPENKARASGRLVIDFNDEFHPDARREAVRRFDAYRADGYTVEVEVVTAGAVTKPP